MTGEQKRRAGAGDMIHDEDADRRGIVADVRGGATWVLRPEYGPDRWTSQRPDRCTTSRPRVIKTREERPRERSA